MRQILHFDFLIEFSFYILYNFLSFLFQDYQKSLEALCTFGSGFNNIEDTPKNLETPKNIEDIILSLQHGLLRSATTHTSKGKSRDTIDN